MTGRHSGDGNAVENVHNTFQRSPGKSTRHASKFPAELCRNIPTISKICMQTRSKWCKHCVRIPLALYLRIGPSIEYKSLKKLLLWHLRSWKTRGVKSSTVWTFCELQMLPTLRCIKTFWVFLSSKANRSSTLSSLPASGSPESDFSAYSLYFIRSGHAPFDVMCFFVLLLLLLLLFLLPLLYVMCWSLDAASVVVSNHSAFYFLYWYEGLSEWITQSLFALGGLGRRTCFKFWFDVARLCYVYRLSLIFSTKTFRQRELSPCISVYDEVSVCMLHLFRAYKKILCLLFEAESTGSYRWALYAHHRILSMMNGLGLFTYFMLGVNQVLKEMWHLYVTCFFSMDIAVQNQSCNVVHISWSSA
jgi:hypothetical protein